MYKWRSGMWAYVLQRASGAALALYLILHVWVTHYLIEGPEQFDQAMGILSNPVVKLMEIALLAGVIFHALNGVRLLLIDTGWGVRREKGLFWAVMAVGGVLLVAGAIPLLPHF